MTGSFSHSSFLLFVVLLLANIRYICADLQLPIEHSAYYTYSKPGSKLIELEKACRIMTYYESSFEVRWITFQVPISVHLRLRKCWSSNAQESRNGRLWQLKLVISFSHLSCWKCLSLQQIIHFVLQYTVQM